MAFFGKNTNNKVYGVALYLAAVWILYGRKEVLPKNVIKKTGQLDDAKRDKATRIEFANKGSDTMYARGLTGPSSV